MSVDITFRALQQWPKEPTKRRRHAPFRSSHSDTITLLERELKALGAREAVIEADCERSEIRLDGHLRSGAKLRGPGIVLRFETKAGPLTFPCDSFLEWQDNMRAIALALEALRKIDRYGVTSTGEQYRGWLALPAPTGTGPFADAAAAKAWIAMEFELSPEALPSLPWGESSKEFIRKRAVIAFHPDKHQGDDSRWKLWQQAAAMLGIEV